MTKSGQILNFDPLLEGLRDKVCKETIKEKAKLPAKKHLLSKIKTGYKQWN
jgi:hypothetical protein